MKNDKIDHRLAPSDNPVHWVLFALPPIQTSASTALAAPEMPAQKIVTGDDEVDAVLWLREVISTGNAHLISKAKEAAARIKTPLKDLEKRYLDHLLRAHLGNWVAGMASIGFADLDGLAGASITRATRRHEAQARFGDAIFADTPAEQFCFTTLKGLVKRKRDWNLDEEKVDKRFDACPAQRPGTLTDCVLEMTYWSDLYWLRNAVDRNTGDTAVEINARQDYVFRCLARIRPRDPDEAAEVYRYLASNDGMDRAHTGAIILNLIGAPEPYKAKQKAAHE